jgi:hypothetical protein
MRSEALLTRLLWLWLGSFAGLLGFLYTLMIGVSIDGKSVLELMFR